MSTTGVDGMSTADLEKILADRKKEENDKRERARNEYETRRDKTATDLVKSALQMNAMLAEFKTTCYRQLKEMQDVAHEYGAIRKHSKGGFSIRSADGNLKATLRRNVSHEYDERGDMALNLIRDFLETTIKKRDMQTYRVIAALLEKNSAGELEPSRVASLLKIKDNYPDERWVKAMQLLTEGYREREVSYNVEFFQKDEIGKDRPICLTFASIPVKLVDDSEPETSFD